MRRLRDTDPVHRPSEGGVVLTRYDDVATVLRDPSFGAGRDALVDGLRRVFGEGHAFAYISRRLTNYDPPDHSRLRGLVNRAFTSRRVQQLRPYIVALADQLLDDCDTGDPFDFVAQVAHPLPSMVICELLGVPGIDRSAFDRWTSAIAFLIGPSVPADRQADGEAAVAEEWACIDALINQRRRDPGEDLLSALTAAQDDTGASLSHDELVATVIFLFSAGHQTTRDLLGSGVLSLLEHRDEWRRLAEDPGLAGSTVEECLRYEPPVNFTMRRALRDTEVAGEPIAAGENVVPVIVAANRDPRRFTDPDRFDITRADTAPLSFGGGIHFCLGAALARVEAEIVLHGLARRFPRLTLADNEIQWRETIAFRGPEAVAVIP